MTRRRDDATTKPREYLTTAEVAEMRRMKEASPRRSASA